MSEGRTNMGSRRLEMGNVGRSQHQAGREGARARLVTQGSQRHNIEPAERMPAVPGAQGPVEISTCANSDLSSHSAPTVASQPCGCLESGTLLSGQRGGTRG